MIPIATQREIFVGRLVGSVWIIGNARKHQKETSANQLSAVYLAGHIAALHALWFPSFWYGMIGRGLMSPVGWAITIPVATGAGLAWKIDSERGVKNYAKFLIDGPTMWPIHVRQSIDLIAEHQADNPGVYPVFLGVESEYITEKRDYNAAIGSTLLQGFTGNLKRRVNIARELLF